MENYYSSPPGTYDLPFTWGFNDIAQMTNGNDYLNQLVYIKGGYGKFVLRRIVGLNRVLNPTTGQYQIRDGMSNNIEAVPVFAPSADDIGILPELIYPEQGGIRFDLYKVLKPTVPTTGQIAFQGVRRMTGSAVQNPSYLANAKTFTYTMTATINSPVGTITTARVPIDNYDFELYQLIILYNTGGSVGQTIHVWSENSNGVDFTNITASSVTLTMTDQSTPSLPLTVSVVGTHITIQLATDGAGNISSTNQDVVTAFNLVPAATALLSILYVQGSELGPSLQTFIGGSGTEVLFGGATGGMFAPVTVPMSSLWIYDQNRVQIANQPIVDLYCDGGPRGVYKNGAIVTPLWYKKDSQIQIDFYSQIASGSAQVIVYLVGKKYYPCG